MNPCSRVAEAPPGFCTVTDTGPAGCAGVTPVMVVTLWTTTPVAGIPSKNTSAPSVKPEPDRMNSVPPVTGPKSGRISEIVTEEKVNPLSRVALAESGLVTVTPTVPCT